MYENVGHLCSFNEKVEPKRTKRLIGKITDKDVILRPKARDFLWVYSYKPKYMDTVVQIPLWLKKDWDLTKGYWQLALAPKQTSTLPSTLSTATGTTGIYPPACTGPQQHSKDSLRSFWDTIFSMWPLKLTTMSSTSPPGQTTCTILGRSGRVGW